MSKCDLCYFYCQDGEPSCWVHDCPSRQRPVHVGTTRECLHPPQRDPIVELVRDDLLRRSQVGLLKYGVGLDRDDLSLRDWLQHAYEEALDLANYLRRSIHELDGRK